MGTSALEMMQLHSGGSAVWGTACLPD